MGNCGWDVTRTVTQRRADRHVGAAGDELFDDVHPALRQAVGWRDGAKWREGGGGTSVAAIMSGVQPLLLSAMSG